jgi:hypothetical protein
MAIDGADIGGTTRSNFAAQGIAIGNTDLWIATHGKSPGLTIVTIWDTIVSTVPNSWNYQSIFRRSGSGSASGSKRHQNSMTCGRGVRWKVPLMRRSPAIATRLDQVRLVVSGFSALSPPTECDAKERRAPRTRS